MASREADGSKDLHRPADSHIEIGLFGDQKSTRKSDQNLALCTRACSSDAENVDISSESIAEADAGLFLEAVGIGILRAIIFSFVEIYPRINNIVLFVDIYNMLLVVINSVHF